MSEQGSLVAIARHAKSRAKLELLESVRVSKASGLEGDCRGAKPMRQVTLLSAEAWQAVCAELGAELPWTLRRGNLLVSGLDLPRVVGARLAVGALQLEVTEEVRPCQRMDEQQAGLMAALDPDWRGGIACRVLEGAVIRIGDPVSLQS